VAIPTELPKSQGDKEKAAADAISSLNKDYGHGTVIKLGERTTVACSNIPTGIYAVDNKVLGIGGFPKGRIIEIFGPESGGKTTMLLRLIAEAQQAGGLCAIIDAEHALSPFWATQNGVNVDELVISQPDSGEQALEVAEALISSGAFAVIGIDSVAALVPRAELEGEMGDSHMGLQARLMSQALRKLTAAVSRTNTILVFINQIREKIGVMFGNPETTSGGRALKFYSSVRLDVRRIGPIKDGEDIIGNKVRIKAVKNKVAPPFREAEVDLLFTDGFDAVGNILDTAVEKEVVAKAGAWYSYKGERIGQGRNNTVEFLKTNKEIYNRVYREILELGKAV
jgi:recombination protein RecA